MQSHTGLRGLQGVKIYIFALAVIGASLVSSLVQSRPASAESFLQKTVQCVLGALVLYDCRESTSRSPSPAESAPVVTPASPATTPQPVRAEGGTSSPQVPSQPAPVQSGGVPVTVPTDSVQPAPAAPELPAAVHRQPFTYEPTRYLAYMYGTFGQSNGSTINDAPSIKPSAEGWRIFDVAWYWWAAGLATLFIGVKMIKKVRSKENLSIVK